MELGDLNPNDELNAGRWADDELAALSTDGEWQPDINRGLALLREQRRQSAGGRHKWGWLVVGAMAAGISLMATPVTRAFSQRCLSACVDQSGWLLQFLRTGASNPVPSTAYIEPRDRKPAPNFTLTDAAGQPVSLSEFRGQVVLINFWATWCAPCASEIPLLIDFQQAYRARGFVVLGVALDDGWNVVRPYAETRKINYRVLIADANISDLFGGLKAVPTTLIIDRRGRVAATHVGLCQKHEYESDIKAVLNE
jgi:cytochrome c biogenesis protein CcmG/thiol:disulfide interchange protein DsbE